MEVLVTMQEEDLKEIGIKSFGLRRRLKLKIDKMKKSDLTTANNEGICSSEDDLKNSLLNTSSLSASDVDSSDMSATSTPVKVRVLEIV